MLTTDQAHAITLDASAMHIALDPQPQTARVTRDAVPRLVDDR